jgi:CRP-like cAMP-binding protein
LLDWFRVIYELIFLKALAFMSSSVPFSESFSTISQQPEIFQWAKSHYRDRIFAKDERIPSRPGLLYLVESGAVRITGKAQVNIESDGEHSASAESEDVFLGFVGAGQPFEIVSQYPFKLSAYAHIEGTSLVWLYWQDLERWPLLRPLIVETFRYQYQRKLFWLSILGQKRSIDRLMGFLALLIEEYGQPCPDGYYLPYGLTHAQIASAIGTTRVTVTRLMGKLKQKKLLFLKDDHLIGLPSLFISGN